MIFPAIDIINSGTRKRRVINKQRHFKNIFVLRKHIDSENAIEELIKLLSQSKVMKIS